MQLKVDVFSLGYRIFQFVDRDLNNATDKNAHFTFPLDFTYCTLEAQIITGDSGRFHSEIGTSTWKRWTRQRSRRRIRLR